jgi:hypothetical protein
MSWLLKAVATGAVSFVATNIDDIFVLALFFGQTGRRGLRRWHIVAGQYIGFAALDRYRSTRPCSRSSSRREPRCKSRCWVVSVAAVTFANGGDNIGIYTPLFAASERAPEHGPSASGTCPIKARTLHVQKFTEDKQRFATSF